MAETLTYLFIRMWAPKAVCSNPQEAHYVQRIEKDDGGIQWTVTREFTDANYFKSINTALRVVQNVRRIVERIKRGWLYEIILVEEEVVESNVTEPEPQEEPA